MSIGSACCLSERLRRDGFDTQLDRYINGTPAEGWPRWMLDRLDEAAFVLVVCTETYYSRFRGHEQPDRGKGVDWEGALITQELYDARSSTLKFVPVLFDAANTGFSRFAPTVGPAAPPAPSRETGRRLDPTDAGLKRGLTSLGVIRLEGLVSRDPAPQGLLADAALLGCCAEGLLAQQGKHRPLSDRLRLGPMPGGLADTCGPLRPPTSPCLEIAPRASFAHRSVTEDRRLPGFPSGYHVVQVYLVFLALARPPQRPVTPRPPHRAGMNTRRWPVGGSDGFWAVLRLGPNGSPHAQPALAAFGKRAVSVLGPLKSGEFAPEGVGDQLGQGQLHGWAGERHDGVALLQPRC